MVVNNTQAEREGQLAEIPHSKITAYKVFVESSQTKNWSKNQVKVKFFVLKDDYFLWNPLLYFSKSNRTFQSDVYMYEVPPNAQVFQLKDY